MQFDNYSPKTVRFCVNCNGCLINHFRVHCSYYFLKLYSSYKSSKIIKTKLQLFSMLGNTTPYIVHLWFLFISYVRIVCLVDLFFAVLLKFVYSRSDWTAVLCAQGKNYFHSDCRSTFIHIFLNNHTEMGKRCSMPNVRSIDEISKIIFA